MRAAMYVPKDLEARRQSVAMNFSPVIMTSILRVSFGCSLMLVDSITSNLLGSAIFFMQTLLSDAHSAFTTAPIFNEAGTINFVVEKFESSTL